MTTRHSSDRIDALETRLTFQDETIETLNKTITAQWQQIDALTRQLANLNERLQEAESHAPARPRTAAALLKRAARNDLSSLADTEKETASAREAVRFNRNAID